VQLRLQALAQRVGLPLHVHPHNLRHSFASHLLQSAQDLRAVQELLGHANISTTQIYTRLDFQHLAASYDHGPRPRARRKDRGLIRAGSRYCASKARSNCVVFQRNMPR